MYCEKAGRECGYLGYINQGKGAAIIEGELSLSSEHKQQASLLVEVTDEFVAVAQTNCRADTCGVVAMGIGVALQHEAENRYLEGKE